MTLYRLSADGGAAMVAILPAPLERVDDVQLNADTIAFLADGVSSSTCARCCPAEPNFAVAGCAAGNYPASGRLHGDALTPASRLHLPRAHRDCPGPASRAAAGGPRLRRGCHVFRAV